MSEALVRLRSWVESSFGFVVQADQLDTFKMRVAQVTEAMGMGSEAELAEAIARGHVETQRRLVDAIAVNHTAFFREMPVLATFFDEALARWPLDREMRVWSAAASTGQELYTLGLVLLERWGEVRVRRHARLMGTDISGSALATATRGRYPSVQLDKIPERYRSGLQKLPGGFEMPAVLREQCAFRRLNLLSSSWPFSVPLDVIFCRNVLYYFPRETAREVLERMYAIAAPGGWLFTSSSEPLRDLQTGWSYLKPGIYRKGPTE